MRTAQPDKAIAQLATMIVNLILNPSSWKTRSLSIVDQETADHCSRSEKCRQGKKKGADPEVSPRISRWKSQFGEKRRRRMCKS
jgi:hypothetical protein